MCKKSNLLFILVIALVLLGGCHKQDIGILEQKEIKNGWSFRQVGEAEWLPATVPGTVHTDLLENKKIDNPFFRLNEHDVQWIDKVNWEYKTTFDVDENMLQRDRVQLVLEGLDTYATVYVNGTPVLQADNMFREWQADVKKYIIKGKNELHIVFRSPIIEGIKKGTLDKVVG